MLPAKKNLRTSMSHRGLVGKGLRAADATATFRLEPCQINGVENCAVTIRVHCEACVTTRTNVLHITEQRGGFSSFGQAK